MIEEKVVNPPWHAPNEGQPCLIHAGPFANIAHANSSLISTMIGRKLGDYFLTESGFGSDMGWRSSSTSSAAAAA